MSRSPTLAEVLRATVNGALESVHTAIPGRVTRYDASKQQADIEPLIQAAYEDEEGNRQVSKLPVVTNCPVHFPGGGGFTLIYPLSEGDTGLLVFSEASIDKWASGDGNVDPDIDHRHHLSDGIFIPGVRAFSNPRSDGPTNQMVVGQDGGNQMKIATTGIVLKAPVISLGEDDVEPIIKGTSFGLTVITPFITALGPLLSASSIPGVIDAALAGAIQTFAGAVNTALAAYATTLSLISKTQ